MLQKIISKFLVFLFGFTALFAMVDIAANREELFPFISESLTTFYLFEGELYIPVSIGENQRVETDIPLYYGVVSDKVREVELDAESASSYKGAKLGYVEGNFMYHSMPDIYEVVLPGNTNAADDLLIAECGASGCQLIAKIAKPYSKNMKDIRNWRKYAQEFEIQFDLEARRLGYIYDHEDTSLMESAYYRPEDHFAHHVNRKLRLTWGDIKNYFTRLFMVDVFW